MYYKVRIKYYDNGEHIYNAYVMAFDKKEASINVRYELLEDEKEDFIDDIIEITENEYLEGVKEFGNGVR